MIKMKIKINKRTYTVVFEKLDRVDLLGECNYKTSTITISTSIDSNLTYTTIVHELTHAYLFEYGLISKTYNNEHVCNFFGTYGKDIIENTTKIINSLKRRL